MNGDEGSETFLSEIINAKQIIGARNMNMESIYEYGSRRGFWRIHNEFEKRKSQKGSEATFLTQLSCTNMF